MFRVTNKKTNESYDCETFDDAKFYVRICVILNNREKMNSDRKTNYIIEEI